MRDPSQPRRESSSLELTFETLLRQLAPGVPAWERDHHFHPTRKWELDFAWPRAKVAVECQGSTYGRPVNCHACGARVRARGKRGWYQVYSAGGAHVRGPRYRKDLEKQNAAVGLGWRVLYVTADLLREDPHPTFELLSELLDPACRVPCNTPDTPTERGAVLGWTLAVSNNLSTRQVAELLNVRPRSARRLLAAVSRVLPVYSPHAGLWSVVEKRNGK